MSRPFAFNNVKDLLLEKLSEILSRYAYVNIVVYLHGNANAVALADAEATGKHNLVVYMIFIHGALEKLNYLRRSLKMAGGAYAYLNEQHRLIPLRESRLRRIR